MCKSSVTFESFNKSLTCYIHTAYMRHTWNIHNKYVGSMKIFHNIFARTIDCVK